MLSIQKITGFVNDCVTFRQKNNLFVQLLPACSPHGRRCVPRDGSLQRQSVRSCSAWGLPAFGCVGTAQNRRRCPFLLIKNTVAACEREERKGETQRSQKKRIYVQYTIRPDKKQPEYGDPAKSSCRAYKRNSFRHRCAMPPPSRREALARRRGVPFCQRLPL